MKTLPVNWTETSLESLLLILESGSRPKGGVKGITKGVHSIGAEHLSYNGCLNLENVKYVPIDFARKMSKGKIAINDILIVKDGATTGKTALVNEAFPFNDAVVNEHVFICRLIPLIEPKFVFRYLVSKEGRERILANFKGSAQGGINLSFAPNTRVVLAPLNEQQRIVAKLEKLMAKVDQCKVRLEKIPSILKRFRQSVLAAACSGVLTKDWRKLHLDVDPADVRLTNIQKERARLIKSSKNLRSDFYELKKSENGLYELPKTWEWVALGNYAECLRGRFSIRPRNDPSYYDGKYPFIQICDLPKEGGYILSHRQTLNDEGLNVSKLFKKGTVVIAIVGATIGNTGIIGYDMCFPDSLVGINTGSEIGNIYLEYFFRNEKEKIRAISYSSGGQPNIKLETLNPYPFPLPPLEEEKEIVHRVEALFKIADQIEERYNRAKEHVDKLTQSILTKAFRGELVPQDTDDEPALELLKRIKAAREKEEQKNKTWKRVYKKKRK